MTIEELKRAASELPPRELSEFADWVVELREERFDERTGVQDAVGKRDDGNQELEPLPVLRGHVPELTKHDLSGEGELDGVAEGVRADTATFESDMASMAEGTEGRTPFQGTYSREDIYFDHD